MFVEIRRLFIAVVALSAASMQVAIADGAWTVAKSSGEVWVVRGETQLVALNLESVLNPGDSIRTGRNGRLLLSRGEERILISPNTAIGIPVDGKSDLPTTIMQQAGSILLEVEKKNVQHFEVETPYLAAVVKGTRFRVSVNSAGARVDVLQGQVQISDFKSGQQIVLLPGQAAKAFARGTGGLSLSGTGRFNAIEQVKPRAPGLRALSVPKGGLAAPRLEAKAGPLAGRTAAGSALNESNALKSGGIRRLSNGAIRIGAALGEVKLDYYKVTKGLARAPGEVIAARTARRDASASSLASDAQAKGNVDSNVSVASNNGGGLALGGLGNVSSNGNGSGNGLASGSGNGSGTGLAVSLGGGSGGSGGLSLGIGSGSGGGGLSLGIGSGSGGGGLSLGIGDSGTGGNGLSLSIGGGGGLGLLGGLLKGKPK